MKTALALLFLWLTVGCGTAPLDPLSAQSDAGPAGLCDETGHCDCPRGFAGASCGVAIPEEWDFEAAADYSRDRGGAALLVLKEGEIVYERYDNGFGPDDAHDIHSATKSFWAMAAVAMVEDGLLSSFDDVAADTIAEWKEDDRAAITVRHLLNLTSGLREDYLKLQGLPRAGHAPDKYAFAVGQPLDSPPGQVFKYGPVHFYAFGELLKRKLAATGQETTLGYLQRRVFEPMGLEYRGWAYDRAGNAHIPNSATLTARQWLKFGEVMLRRGNGHFDASLVAEISRPSVINSAYGLFVWLNNPDGVGNLGQTSSPGSAGGFIYEDGAPLLVGALGAGMNTLFICPELEMVVVRQCRTVGDATSCEGPTGSRDASFTHELLSRLFGTQIEASTATE